MTPEQKLAVAEYDRALSYLDQVLTDRDRSHVNQAAVHNIRLARADYDQASAEYCRAFHPLTRPPTR